MTFKFLYVVITVDSVSLSVVGICRCGSHAVNWTFFDELLEQICLHARQLVMCGDLNIHIDNRNDSRSMRIAELLESFDCAQHVGEPTHRKGRILDLAIMRRDSSE